MIVYPRVELAVLRLNSSVERAFCASCLIGVINHYACLYTAMWLRDSHYATSTLLISSPKDQNKPDLVPCFPQSVVSLLPSLRALHSPRPYAYQEDAATAQASDRLTCRHEARIPLANYYNERWCTHQCLHSTIGIVNEIIVELHRPWFKE